MRHMNWVTNQRALLRRGPKPCGFRRGLTGLERLSERLLLAIDSSHAVCVSSPMLTQNEPAYIASFPKLSYASSASALIGSISENDSFVPDVLASSEVSLPALPLNVNRDVVNFSVTRGAKVAISARVADNSRAEVFLTLFSENGDVLQESGNADENGVSTLFMELPQGNYTLFAETDSRLTQSGALVNVDVNYITDREGFTLQFVDGVAFDPEGRIDFVGDTDNYTFEITKEGPFSMRLNADFDPVLFLYDAQNNLIASDDDSGPGVNSQIIRNLTPGIYRLNATALAFTGLGPYSISVQEVQDNEGGPLQLVNKFVSVHGELDFAGDRDTYTFALDSDSVVNIQMMSDELDTYVRLFNSDGQLVDFNDDNGSSLDSRLFRVVPAGVYTISAGSFADAGVGQFKLELRILNDREGGLLSFQDGKARVTAAFDAPNDLDTFTFRLETRQHVEAQFSSSITPADLTLLSEAGNVLGIGARSLVNGRNITVIRVDLEPGLYRLATSAEGGQTGGYGMTVTLSEPAAAPQNDIYSRLDANKDGRRDFADFAILRSHFGQAGDSIAGDVDEDGQVDLADFYLFRAHLFEASPPS